MITAALLFAAGSAQPSLITSGVLQGLGYGVLAVGLVLVYRVSGVINVAYGATGGLAAATLVTLIEDHRLPYGLALAIAVAVGAGVGAIIELFVVRRLAKAPKVTLLVGTIGVFELLVYATASVRLRSTSALFPTPFHRIIAIGSVTLTGKDLLVIAVVPAIVAGLTLFLARTPTGLAIRASADNPDAANLAGVAVGRTSTIVWAIAGALGAVSTTLVDAEINLIPQHDPVSVGPSVLLSALAAALVGRLSSLPGALLGGMLVGVVRVESQVVFPGTPGMAELVTFLLVLAGVLTFPRSRTRRDDASVGLLALKISRGRPAQETDRTWVRRLPALSILTVTTAATAVPFVVHEAGSLFLADRTLALAVVGLSIVVLTGWAGQVSLGQVAFVGVGGSVTALLHLHGVPYFLAVIEGTFVGVVAAVIVGLPALRVRGPFLAVTTLSFAVAAQQWLFGLAVFGGRGAPLVVSRPAGLTGNRTWYWVCEVGLGVAALAVWRLRSSGVGRSIIAVRANEERAASLSMSPTFAKLSAFAIAGGLSAFAGGLYVAAKGSSGPADYGIYDSLTVVALVVVGGIGSVAGPVVGAAFVLGLPAIFHASAAISVLTSGVGLLVILLYLPGGLMQVATAARDVAVRAFGTTEVTDFVAPAAPTRTGEANIVSTVPSRGLEQVVLAAHAVSVSFGGRKALDSVDLEVRQGEILGLIGANGAGKSTLLDALSGFVRLDEGSIDLLGKSVTNTPAHLRAAGGLGRVFQDARLFGDLTVRETFAVACTPAHRALVFPVILGLPSARTGERLLQSRAKEVVSLLGLGVYADTPVQALSTGTRRVVELGCLIAQEAQILLLDEPTAGLAQREAEAFGPLLLDVRAQLNATIVVVEHDIPLVLSLADRVQCLSAGSTIAIGTPTDIRMDPAVIAAYLGTEERAVARSGPLASVLPVVRAR